MSFVGLPQTVSASGEQTKHLAITPFANTFLVVNTRSAGNVGKIAIDLLVENNPALSKVGYYQSQFLEPIVEVSEGQQSLQLPAQVYQIAKYTILQIRVPAKESRKLEFQLELHQFIKTQKFLGVIFLASLPLSGRIDFEINSQTPNAYRYLSENFNATQSTDQVLNFEQTIPLTKLIVGDLKVSDLLQDASILSDYASKTNFIQFNYAAFIVYAQVLPDYQQALKLAQAFIQSQADATIFKPIQLTYTPSQGFASQNYKLSSSNVYLK